uniref:Uncharacterized protein n=1 Tax=Arundo donax TaxID=35708 RepID=A0A0A9F2U2_ARUDO
MPRKISNKMNIQGKMLGKSSKAEWQHKYSEDLLKRAVFRRFLIQEDEKNVQPFINCMVLSRHPHNQLLYTIGKNLKHE